MTPWNAFYPDLLSHVDGCPNPVANVALLRAARDFCTQTRAWRMDFDAITLLAGTAEYDLPLPNDAELIRLEDYADVNGDRIPLTSQQHASFNCDRTLYTVTGRSVIAKPTPEGAGTLMLRASLMPSNTALGVPDDIYGQYVELIAQGAAARLQGQPGKPYTNPGAAGANQAQYQEAVDALKTRLWRGRTNSRPRVIPQHY